MFKNIPYIRRTIYELQNKERSAPLWETSGLFRCIDADRSLVEDCSLPGHFHSRLFQIGLRRNLFRIVNDWGQYICRYSGNHRIHENVLPNDCAADFGNTTLSGRLKSNITDNYAAVLFFGETAVIFDTTTSDDSAIKMMSPRYCEKRIQPLERRLQKKVGYVLVSIGDFKYQSFYSYRAIKDFQHNGGYFVDAPVSFYRFTQEVNQGIKERNLVVDGPYFAKCPDASWLHVTCKNNKMEFRGPKQESERGHHENLVLSRINNPIHRQSIYRAVPA
jgi:hypothetical protein